MKKFLVLLLCLTTAIAYSQRKPKIKGNKAVTDVREELPPFHAIELDDDLTITLQRSANSGYRITADDNLIDVLKFAVEDSTLVVSSFYKITGKKKLEITIDYNDLRSITMQDGRIEMEDLLSTDELRVNLFGSSKLQLNASAPVMLINMEGNSSGDFNLDSDSLNITLRDRSTSKIYTAGGNTTLNMFKNAAAQMEGTTNILTLHMYENSDLKADIFEAATVMATLEDSPAARVYAFKDLTLSSRGSSKTYLYGNPKITISEFLDTSELHKEKD